MNQTQLREWQTRLRGWIIGSLLGIAWGAVTGQNLLLILAFVVFCCSAAGMVIVFTMLEGWKKE